MTPFASFAEAWAFAATLPDVDDGSGPRRPDIDLCLIPPANPEQVHVESIVLDNAAGSVARYSLIRVQDALLCPDPSSAEATPLVELITDIDTGVSGLSLDLTADGACEAGPRPGVLVTGGGNLNVGDSTIHGWSRFAVARDRFATAHDIVLDRTRLSGGVGVAIENHGAIFMNRSEVVRNRLRASDGGTALISLTSPMGELSIKDSLVFGNLVEHAPATRRAVVRGGGVIWRTAFVANAIDAQDLLLDIGFDTQAVQALGPPPEWAEHGLRDSVFSRNRHVGVAPDFELEPGPLLAPAHRSGERCALLSAAAEPSPFGALAAAAGTLLALNADLGETSRGHVLLSGNSFVNNGPGGGSLIRFDGPGDRATIQLISNTFAGNSDYVVFDSTGSVGAEVELLVAGNLFSAPLDGAAPLQLGDVYEALTITMNSSTASDTMHAAAASSESELLGPNFLAEGLAARDRADVESLTPCERHGLFCGTISEAECEEWLDSGHDLVCGFDSAAAWVPTSASAIELAHPWVWAGELALVESSLIPGATGLACGTPRLSLDDADLSLDGSFGDGDGFPDLVDCDNSDEDSIPIWPADDGFRSEFCEELEESCYLCPFGPNPRPQDDDDSAEDDDDDSTPPPTDDDDSSASSPSPTPPPTVSGDDGGGGPGCLRACGFAWNPPQSREASMTLSALLLGIWSRRRRR